MSRALLLLAAAATSASSAAAPFSFFEASTTDRSLPPSSFPLAPLASRWKPANCKLLTEWGAQLNASAVLPAYPRPTRVRDLGWANLNGVWEWEASGSDPSSAGPVPFGRALNGTILVPFPVEACLSGVGVQGIASMYYRAVFDAAAASSWPRALLHLGAVDWNSTVYLNAQQLGAPHLGGYDEASFDVTSLLKPTNNELIVYAFDPTGNGVQPQGKQLINAAGGDHYTPTSGIWQTVWLEGAPATYIADLDVSGNLTHITVNATVAAGDAPPPAGVTVDVSVIFAGSVVATGSGAPGSAIAIAVPSPQLWSPASPNLYDVNVTACTADKSVCDAVSAYTGMRTFSLGQTVQPAVPATPLQTGVGRNGQALKGSPFPLPSSDPTLCAAACAKAPGCVAWSFEQADCGASPQQPKPMCTLLGTLTGGDVNICKASASMATPGGVSYTRPLLNGAFTFFAGMLDQSWTPDGQYTYATDDFLRYDLQLTKDLGFNHLRVHQKVETDRRYYFADVIGVAIFQDGVQKFGQQGDATISYFESDLYAMVQKRVKNHPCILQIEICNESDSVRNKTFADAVPSMIEWLRANNPGRLVDTDSGGPLNDLHLADVDDLHTYPTPGLPKTSDTQYGMVGEWGGFGLFPADAHTYNPGRCWGYRDKADNSTQLAAEFIVATNYMQSLKALGLSVSVYTQVTDVEDECDGIAAYDRTPKLTSDQATAVAAANAALIAA